MAFSSPPPSPQWEPDRLALTHCQYLLQTQVHDYKETWILLEGKSWNGLKNKSMYLNKKKIHVAKTLYVLKSV